MLSCFNMFKHSPLIKKKGSRAFLNGTLSVVVVVVVVIVVVVVVVIDVYL